MSSAPVEGIALRVQSETRARSNGASPKRFLPLSRTRLEGTFTNGWKIESCRAMTLKRRPGSRHIAAYRLTLVDRKTGEQTSLELIGKRDTTRAGGKAAKEFQAMSMLWAAGFGQDGQFRIPKPVHLFPDEKFIVQERVRGPKLSSELGRNTPISRAHAGMAGLWLARLHSLQARPEVRCSYEEDFSTLQRFVTELSATHPCLAPRLQALASSIRRQLESFRDVPVAMVHGDYHPEHIFVVRGRVTVIDFERFCFADPAKDLGSFIAHTRTLACLPARSFEAANHEISEFLKGYFSAMSLAKGAATAQRIAPFVSHSCLEALYYVACVLQVKDSERIAMYLQCAEGSGIPRLGRLHAVPREGSRAS